MSFTGLPAKSKIPKIFKTKNSPNFLHSPVNSGMLLDFNGFKDQYM